MYRLDDVVRKLATVGSTADLPAREDEFPRAAVAPILREGPEGAEVFFIRRAESPKDPWSGHIAFPGGRHEVSDESLLATAIRETREEVGIDLSRAELVARLPEVPAFIRSKRGRLVVTPFVFAMREDVAPILNYEVAGTLWVPLASFVRGDGKGTYAFTWEDKPYELPCYRLEPDQLVLWGMTHRMLESMLEALA